MGFWLLVFIISLPLLLLFFRENKGPIQFSLRTLLVAVTLTQTGAVNTVPPMARELASTVVVPTKNNVPSARTIPLTIDSLLLPRPRSP